MMISELLEIGDKVSVTVPQENRDWGYNPCPDGSTATVIGFTEIDYGRTNNFGNEPGIYENKAWVKIQLESGKIYTEYGARLEMVNSAEYDTRVKLWNFSEYKSKKLRDLPETPFWEDDIVKFQFKTGKPKELGIISRINYIDLNKKRDDGSEWPIYQVKFKSSGTTSANQSQMKLIERGNVWKYYHGEPLEFKNIQEKASFFSSLGHTYEIRNPVTNLYTWTKSEILSAIEFGIAHGFSMCSGFFGSGLSIRAIKFRDENLGMEVARETLNGFRA